VKEVYLRASATIDELTKELIRLRELCQYYKMKAVKGLLKMPMIYRIHLKFL
jgi:hypothetical protein